MTSENQVNRIKCTAKIHKMMDSFYKSMFDGRLVSWGMGPIPYEILSVAGVANFLTENTAARIAAAQQQDMYINYAESEGLGEGVCSYAKINIGQSLMMARGLEHKIPERFRIPKPDMLGVLSSCPSMVQWASCLADIFNVPLFAADGAYLYDAKENWRRNVQYAKSQLEDLIIFLEKVTGRPFDWEALKEIVKGIRKMSIYRRQILELNKVKPAPGSFIDAATSMAPSLTLLNEEAFAFYKDYFEELIERVINGVGVLQDEKYRLMWRGNFPWFKMGTISRMLAKYGAVIVSGCYGFDTYGNFSRDFFPPDGFNLDDPLETIAAEHCAGGYLRTFEWKWENEFKHYIDGFSIDGVIIHAPYTCRPWTLTTYDMAARVEQEYGLPVLVLDTDHTDARYFQDAQVETRIQALLERIDANRAAKLDTGGNG